ncbi:uncharacterized protein LOC135130477 isoform X2 [Zophobas morio]|uniref:uncharacterized protein LOC135130477 isoform X2 n=1 Tax=Zophobas morio TaxID=2755281 RepID=UPI00308270A7
MGDETFASRDEAIDFGKDYEYLMAAYYGLKLSFCDEIKDFKLSTNNNDFGDFDDVVIECTMTNGEEHLFALQLKHVIRPIAQITLITNNKKFGLKKYIKEFQKVKAAYKKNRSYTAPFQNFHFVLFSNSALEKGDDFTEEWKKLEPLADGKVVESDLCIRRNENCFGENLLAVAQSEENFLYEFKSEKEDSPDEEFFQQFAFFTEQKDAKAMEALIAETVLKKFRDCDPNIAVNYMNYFSYWCRRDYGTLKLTKEDVRVKLAELVLTPYIPDPDMEKLEYLSDIKAELVKMVFLLFDIVVVDVQTDDELINRLWEPMLKEFTKMTKQWTTPFPAYSENFNEMSLKKLYMVCWHAANFPLVLKLDKNPTRNEDILSGIELCENNGNKKKFLLIGDNQIGNFDPKWTILKTISDLETRFGDFLALIQEHFFVSFQGRPAITLKELLKMDKCLSESVSTKEIIHMSHDDFVIGTDYKKTFPKYYIPRDFPKLILRINAINELGNELFVVSSSHPINDKNLKVNLIDVDKYLLLKQFGRGKNYTPKQIKVSNLENRSQDDDNFFISVNGCCTKQQFEEICSMNEGKNCHHVRFIDEEKLEWIESRYSIDNIQKYAVDSKTLKPEDFVQDKNLLSHFKNKINVICAEPGMGKSVTMKNLALACPSDHWVVMISLGEHATFFQQERDSSEVLKYFLKMEQQTPFVKHVTDALSSKKQILFLWDGFDELPDKCVKFVVKAVKDMASEGYPQWVAARTNSRELLQKAFTVLSLTLPEFSRQNQYDYVYYHLKEIYQDDAKVQEVIDEVDKNITVSLNCGYFDYTGIPLQIHMVVDIHLRKPNNLTTSSLITLTDIYQKFIEGKFDTLFEKADADLDNPYMQEIRSQYIASQLVLYEKAAMKTYFDDQLVATLDLECDELCEELEEGADSLGLITGVSNEKKFVFAHKTYEEFLVASWLVKNWQNCPDLMKILFEAKYSNVRLMFDILMARDSPIHLAVLYRNIDVIKQHEEDIESCKDKGGRSVLHVACSWGRRHPLVAVVENDTKIEPVISSDEFIDNYCLGQAQFLKRSSSIEASDLVSEGIKQRLTKLYHSEDNTTTSASTISLNMNSITKVDLDDEAYLEILKFLLDHKCNVWEKDILLNWDVFQYADQSLSLGVINLLIKYHKVTIKSLNNYSHVPTLLHYSVIFSYDNLFDTITDVPYIEYRFHFGRLNLLQMASEANNLKFVNELLKHKPYKEVINNQSPFGGNLLTSAAFHGNLEMLESLLENGAKVNGHVMPPLYAAVLGKKSDCFSRLLRAGADVNETASDGNSALTMSTMMNRIDFMELLLESGCDVNYVSGNLAPLYCAAGRMNLEAVRLILKYKPDVNYQCEDTGYTALHAASKSDNPDITKCLLDHGASTKIKSKKLVTPLHVALINGKKEVALELIKADPSVVNEYTSELTPVSLATVANFPDVIETLAKYGADVNAAKSKLIPLQFAASRQFDSCVVELIKAGASVNRPDESGATPLFSATDHLTTVKILLDNGADINAASKSGETIVHSAAHGGKVEVMKELVERGADLNCRNNANWTPLCIAILNKQLAMTKYLLTQRVCVKDPELLCAAVKVGFMDCVQLLIELGAEINAKDSNGFTPLYYAMFFNSSCIKILLENGADPNYTADLQIPPLLFALGLSETSVMNQLINSGANIQGLETVTSLHFAAELGDIFSLVFLAGNGADVNASDKNGRIPLHSACQKRKFSSILQKVSDNDFSVYIHKNKEDCISELLVRGSHVNQKDNEGLTPLHMACRDKCVEAVRLLLQHGADVNVVNNKGHSALHMCCDDENTHSLTEIVKMLVDHGINVNLKDNEERTALVYACASGDLDSLKYLHQNGADLFVEDSMKDTLLSSAARHTTLLKYLVDNGLKVNHANVNGLTPLFQTISCSNRDGTRYLIERGADIDALTIQHATPIHAAVLKGDVEIVKLLLELNADLSIKCIFGNTAISASYNNLEIIKLFAEEFGGLKDGETKNGITKNDDLRKQWTRTFLFAASKGCLENLRFLCDSGLAQVIDKDEANACTALHNACSNGHYDVAVYLIENGADVNVKNVNGDVPLCFAANSGYLDIVKLLMEHGAELDVPNHHGTTGLYAAAANGHLKTVEFLYENGANVNVVDADGDTPLHDAAHNGHLSVVQYLVLHRANTSIRNKNKKTALDLAVDQGNQDVVDFLTIHENV